ncbi:MAG: trimethylamine methyltransferase family protein [Proteobacteria bacterium]|nr:trimethylamine methyltransferase family protein [Pseudomonadota bacterium]
MKLASGNAFFSDDERALMRERVFQLLRRNGVRMDHPVVLERLAEAGAEVERATGRVRFPETFLDRALAQVPSGCTLAGAGPEWDRTVPSPDGTFLVRSNTGAPFFLDPNSGERRSVTIADVAAWARLADALDGVDFCPFPSPSDVPTQTADVHALRAMLENTRKHVWVQPYSGESVEHLVRLAAAVCGGEAALRERPRISMITCSLTPLDFKFMDLEIIVQASAAGVPLHACSLPSAGTTAPMTIPGTVVLAAAEILTMVAVAQTLQPGTPVIATPLVFFGDMATGSSVQSSVEAVQGKAAAVELMRAAFGLPTHTYGFGSDGPVPEAQSALESALLAAAVCSAGVDILGGAGQLEVATTISPVQLVMDEELGGWIRRFAAGLTVNDDTLAWEELLATEPGGEFLSRKHTFRHCRDAYRSKLLTRDSINAWQKKGKVDLPGQALERYRALAAREAAPCTSPEVSRELDTLVRAADERLVK